jgi:uncharacterized protein (DUF302 family)
VERIDAVSSLSFIQLATAFEALIPTADLSAFERMVASRSEPKEVERAVEGMVGKLGFVALAKINQGPLVSLLGNPKEMTLYLIGNPVLANRMYEQHRAVGLYAPLRVSIYQGSDRRAHITYERPSGLLAQFNNQVVREVASVLDQRMEELITLLA